MTRPIWLQDNHLGRVWALSTSAGGWSRGTIRFRSFSEMSAYIDAFLFDLPLSRNDSAGFPGLRRPRDLSGNSCSVIAHTRLWPPERNETYMIHRRRVTYVNALDQNANLEGPAECSWRTPSYLTCGNVTEPHLFMRTLETHSCPSPPGDKGRWTPQRRVTWRTDSRIPAGLYSSFTSHLS